MTEEEIKRELANMKPSTREFAMNRCAENRARMEREANGDYGKPSFFVSGPHLKKLQKRI